MIGKVSWVDLTVSDAPRIRNFYKAVVGWQSLPVSMGDYTDFNMSLPGKSEPAVGICHARGHNAQLPPQWLIYVPVANLEASIAACEQLGGKVVCRHSDRYVVIQDPAGAVMMIYQDDTGAGSA